MKNELLVSLQIVYVANTCKMLQKPIIMFELSSRLFFPVIVVSYQPKESFKEIKIWPEEQKK